MWRMVSVASGIDPPLVSNTKPPNVAVVNWAEAVFHLEYALRTAAVRFQKGEAFNEEWRKLKRF